MAKKTAAAPAVAPAIREFLKCFTAELFLPHLTATTKDAALEEMLDALVERGGVRDRALLLDMLHRRESLGSTGIGKGVALPHGRSLSVRELVVVVGRSLDGIPFDAIDDKPVHHIFLIVAPPQDKESRYLTVLGRVVDLVKDAASRKKLLKVETFDEFVACVEAHRFEG